MISVAVCYDEKTGDVLQSWWMDSKKEIDDSQLPEDAHGKYKTLVYLEDVPDQETEEMEPDWVEEFVQKDARTFEKVMVNKNAGRMKPVTCDKKPVVRPRRLTVHRFTRDESPELFQELSEVTNSTRLYCVKDGKLCRREPAGKVRTTVKPVGFLDDAD